jgi:hypothetical protein
VIGLPNDPDLAAVWRQMRALGFDDATLEEELLREAREHAAGRSRIKFADWRMGVPVPTILRLYRYVLEREARRPAPPQTPHAQAARRRGRRPTITDKVKAAMLADLRDGKLTAAQLRGEKEEVLTLTYGHSRDTCRRARAAALSEFGGN